MQGKTTGAGIEGLGERLKGINPHNGWNPLANCMACAIETAEVLTLNKKPSQVGTDSPDAIPEDREALKTFEGKSAAKVWEWLFKNLKANTVYLVERSNGVDHVWNLVRDVKGDIYLIDSNQHTFRRLTGPGDGPAEVRNDPNDIEVGKRTAEMDYLASADEGGSDEATSLDVYEWGPLHPDWAARL
jgi:hypothetical protein